MFRLAKYGLGGVRFISRVAKYMENFCVVPDLVDTCPKDYLEVIYACGIKPDLGNELTPSQCKQEPCVTYKANPKCFYTLVMVDLDAPTHLNPRNKEWNHWLVTNIPGNDVTKGEVLSAYISIGPPEESGFHRYVLLVFSQMSRQKFDEPRLSNTSIEGRLKFSTRCFALKYLLTGPVAGNFFMACWDEYVPKLYEMYSPARKSDAS